MAKPGGNKELPGLQLGPKNPTVGFALADWQLVELGGDRGVLCILQGIAELFLPCSVREHFICEWCLSLVEYSFYRKIISLCSRKIPDAFNPPNNSIQTLQKQNPLCALCSLRVLSVNLPGMTVMNSSGLYDQHRFSKESGDREEKTQPGADFSARSRAA